MKTNDPDFHNIKLKLKISQGLYIKQYQPSLNSQEEKLKLKLFN